jgi:hypothetical protein
LQIHKKDLAVEHHGVAFFHWKLEDDPVVSILEKPIADKDVQAWCLLIPQPLNSRFTSPDGYHLITYDWAEMSLNGDVDVFVY